jgi:hypothetical protein
MSSGKIAALEKEHNFLQDKAADDSQRVQELENKNRLAATQITELHMQVCVYDRGGRSGARGVARERRLSQGETQGGEVDDARQ